MYIFYPSLQFTHFLTFLSVCADQPTPDVPVCVGGDDCAQHPRVS